MAHQESVVVWQVVDALREIEHEATHDMCDRARVTRAIVELGRYEAAQWLAANRHMYFKMLARARAMNETVCVAHVPLTRQEAREYALAALAR